MRRELGTFETALTLSDAFAPLNVVVVLRLAEGPPPEALRRALDALQARHPLLRVRIEASGRGYCYEQRQVPAIPLRREEREADGAWIPEAEAELGRRLDAATGPLVRCTYLCPAGGGRCEILLTFHHAIMDAASAVNLCRELLAACANPGCAEPKPPVDAGGPLPLMPAADDMLPPAWQGFARRRRIGRFLLGLLGEEAVDRWRAKGRWHAPADPAARNRILSFQLSEDETSALVKYSRRRRLTLHSVFDAALLLAMARQLYPGESLPLRHLVFASLRPYLRPPIADNHLGSYFAMLRFTTPVGPESELFGLAGAINAQVHAAAKRGAKYAFSLTSAAAMRGLLRLGSQRMAATALSYTGAVRFDEAGPYPVLGLHAFVSNFHLGPESAAQVRLFAGRLWWDIVYLDADLDPPAARRLADEIRTLLSTEGET